MNDLSHLNETILGSPEPLGAVLLADGVHFAVASADADAIDVCLFDEAGQEIERIPLPGRTGDIHHGFIPGLKAGQRYGLRTLGPWRPHEGLRFNAAKLLV